MAATVTPSGHVITQSEQFFGGFQLCISIDQKNKNIWSCPSCGCNNMGKSKLCGLCGLLNPKYIVKPKDMHKKSMVTKERGKLLNSKDTYKKIKCHFPKFSKYKTTSTPLNKRRKSGKSPHKNVINRLDLTISPRNRNNPLIFNFDPDNQFKPTHKDTVSFIDSVFGNINFNNPFGVVTEEIPTIISDEDEEDLPLTPASLGSNDNTEDLPPNNNINNNSNGLLSLSDRLNNINMGVESQLPDGPPPQHERQVSISAPTTPPSRIKQKERYRIKVNNKCGPLLFGVIHTPAPSKKNRLNIVLQNVENIIKYKFDGVFFINHGYSANHLVSVIKDIHKKYPQLWLGANFLGIPEKKIFKFVKSNKLHRILKGIWCESSGIELGEDELSEIFVHNFGRLTSIKNRKINQFSDIKYDDDEPTCSLIKNTSNVSAVSSGSTKSNNSETKSKKRVTFSGNNKGTDSPSHKGIDSPIILKPIITNTNTNTNINIKQLNMKKKDDSFARNRLNRMNKYKFHGLYFGGVDLKSSKCIKIPTQKSIRTRRRTYSATSDVIGHERGHAGSPRSPKADSILKRFKRSKKLGARTNRSISQHSGTPIKNGKYHKNSKRKDRIKLRKSLSSNIITDGEDNDSNVLATISSEDEINRTGTPIPSKITIYSLTKQNRYGKVPIPKSMKTKSSPHTSITKTKYNITPKRFKNKKHNYNKYIIKNKKNIKIRNINTKNKQIYSMTDSEINDDISDDLNIDATFFPSNLATAKSLELTEVKPKSPLTPDSMESPPPLPSTPDYNLSTNNIKLHNMSLHKPIDTDSIDTIENILSHSQSMPHTHTHTAQLSQESSNTSLHSRGSFNSDDVNGDAISVYSHTSQLSETWSEFGSINETMDDYFEALNTLGKYASKGYMDVITTSGKGKNIETKIKALKEACHKKCLLAVASGIRIENLESFLPYVDILMVSTCISVDFHKFDARKMAKFKRTVDNYFIENKGK